MILGKSYLGATEITKAYLGSNVVYEAGIAGTEIYPSGDAISYTEADFLSITAGLTPIGSWGTNGTTTSLEIAGLGKTDTEAYDGSYCMKYTAKSAYVAGGRAFAIVSGKSYKVSFYAKTGVGTTGGAREWTGFTTIPTETFTSSWLPYEYTLVANDTTVGIKFFPAFGGAAEDTIYVDYFSILEL